jgi:uncharacterized membrane protein
VSNYINRYFDHLSDSITEWMGSNASILIHTILFTGFFLLRFFGVSLDGILLALTTIVSLEAIYLAIFIQRSVNKQTVRLETAISKIELNVAENLEQPLDEVVGEIRKIVQDTHDAMVKAVVEESDQVVREVGEKVEEETDELAVTLKRHHH